LALTRDSAPLKLAFAKALPHPEAFCDMQKASKDAPEGAE
jgi:hypothetical protein